MTYYFLTPVEPSVCIQLIMRCICFPYPITVVFLDQYTRSAYIDHQKCLLLLYIWPHHLTKRGGLVPYNLFNTSTFHWSAWTLPGHVMVWFGVVSILSLISIFLPDILTVCSAFIFHYMSMIETFYELLNNRSFIFSFLITLFRGNIFTV